MRRRHTPKPGWNDDDNPAPEATTPAEIDKQITEATKEVTDTVGMSGSLGRVSSGGVGIKTGAGVEVIRGGVRKTTIEPDGDLFVGADIDDPAGLSLGVFVNAQNWNGEDMEEGDALLGDNSPEKSNVKWDASEGQWQFRLGTTANVYMDTDGTLKAAGGDITLDNIGIVFENQTGNLAFKDTSGDRTTIKILSDGDDFLLLQNKVDGKGIRFLIDTTNGLPVSAYWQEDTGNANVTQLHLGEGAAGGKLTIGDAVAIWAGKDGTETVFNDDSFDIDFRVESATNTHAFHVDAGLEAIKFFDGDVAEFDDTNNLVTLGDVATVDFGTDKRLEIGSDHYFPTRASSNPNVYINEANQDMDLTIEGVSGINLKSDAGLDAVGIGGEAESGYKLKVHGKITATDDILIGTTSVATAEYVDNQIDGFGGAGTYTPTLTAVTNVDSVTAAGDFHYMQILNTVIGGGDLSIDPTAATGTTRVEISLPIASDFTTAQDAIGNGTAQVTNTTGSIAADTADNRLALQFQSPTTSSMAWRVMFIYQIK